MVCTLCLKEIKDGEKSVEIDGRIRHESCSKEFEKMIVDLEKIYEDDCPKDI